MATLTTLPKLQRYAAGSFELSGLEIERVDPDRIRIVTPHVDDERFERRKFWLWLFAEICGAFYVTDDAFCTFIVGEQRKMLPPTIGDRVRRMVRLPVTQRLAPRTTKLIAVQHVSFERRHLAVIREGSISFLVPQQEAVELRRLGITVDEEPCFGKYEVILHPAWMQSLTLPIAQVLFLWLV